MVDTRTTRFVEISERQHIEECHRRNFESWANGLTEEQYLTREKGIKKILASFGMDLRYWVLEDSIGKDGEYEIVSACETMTRPVFIRAHKDAPIETVPGMALGSVFTAPRFRGKSYAKDMMRDLVTMTDSIGMSTVVLYSDVGEYYAQFGYTSISTKQIKIELDKSTYQTQVFANTDENVSFITTDDEIAELAELDTRLLKEKMEANPNPSFAMVPSAGVHIHTKWRALYLGPLIGTPKERPTRFGAKVGQSQILWTQDYGSKTLYVTRLLSLDKNVNDIVALLKAAVNEAAYWSLPYVCVWGQDVPEGLETTHIVEAYKDATTTTTCYTHDREGSLPMYHVSPSVSQPIEWVMSGKYAWF